MGSEEREDTLATSIGRLRALDDMSATNGFPCDSGVKLNSTPESKVLLVFRRGGLGLFLPWMVSFEQ